MPFLTNDPLPQCLQIRSAIVHLPLNDLSWEGRLYLPDVKCLGKLYQRPRFLTRPHGRSLSRSHPVRSAGNVRSWEGTMTVAVTRRELGAGDLRREAKRCRDAAASRRMLGSSALSVQMKQCESCDPVEKEGSFTLAP